MTFRNHTSVARFRYTYYAADFGPLNLVGWWTRLFVPWRWRQKGPIRFRYATTTLLNITTKKTSTWIFTVMKTSYLVSGYLYNPVISVHIAVMYNSELTKPQRAWLTAWFQLF